MSIIRHENRILFDCDRRDDDVDGDLELAVDVVLPELS
jgi:hypothetical protein